MCFEARRCCQGNGWANHTSTVVSHCGKYQHIVNCGIRILSGQVDNTDAEGRLILADALCYSHSFKPAAVLDVATLTGAVDVALGAGAAAVFTNSSKLWDQLHEVRYHLKIIFLMT